MYTCKILKVNLLNLLQIYRSIRTSLGFPCGSAGKESTCSEGDLDSIPGLGRSPGEGKGLPTSFFWPGEFHGLYSPWGHKESDTAERLSITSLGFPWWSNGEDLAYQGRGCGSIPSGGAKIPHASGSKNSNIKQKQYCNRFNKDFKNGPHKKNL